jgi:hypothetical protein
MSDKTPDRDAIDLDTADAVLEDVTTNVVPWINMAERLHTFIRVANAKNLSSVDYRETSKLLDRVIVYVEQYCAVVGKRLEQDRYRKKQR